MRILIDIELIDNLKSSSNILSRYSYDVSNLKNDINCKIGSINLDTRDNNNLEILDKVNTIKMQIDELANILNSMSANAKNAINELSKMDS